MIYNHRNLVFLVITISACTLVEDIIYNDGNRVFLVVIAVSACNIRCMSDPISVLLRMLCERSRIIIFRSDTFPTDKH